MKSQIVNALEFAEQWLHHKSSDSAHKRETAVDDTMVACMVVSQWCFIAKTAWASLGHPTEATASTLLQWGQCEQYYRSHVVWMHPQGLMYWESVGQHGKCLVLWWLLRLLASDIALWAFSTFHNKENNYKSGPLFWLSILSWLIPIVKTTMMTQCQVP